MVLAIVNDHVPHIEGRPILAFGVGRFLRHVFGNTYEWVYADGTHIQYQCAQPIEYEPTLALQRLTMRRQ